MNKTKSHSFSRAMMLIGVMALVSMPFIAVLYFMQAKARPVLPRTDLPVAAAPGAQAKAQFIEDLAKAYQAAHATGASIEAWGALVEKQIDAAHYFADYRPLVETAKELSERVENENPKILDQLVLAEVDIALFEFTEARRLLNSLAEVPEVAKGVAWMAANLNRHLGENLDQLATWYQQQTESTPHKWEAWYQYGITLSRQGRKDAADLAFERALAEYKDDSPFELARICYQRGLNWLHGDEPDMTKARLFLEYAVSYLPGYVPAHIELSQVYRHLHYKGSALELLKAVADQSDPRAQAFLVGLYEKVGESDLASQALDAAKKKYEEMIELVPYVMSDHGVEFYLDLAKDPDRALKLAEMNLRVRPTRGGFAKAIAAAQAAGDATALCRLVEELQRRFPEAKLAGEVACSH